MNKLWEFRWRWEKLDVLNLLRRNRLEMKVEPFFLLSLPLLCARIMKQCIRLHSLVVRSNCYFKWKNEFSKARMHQVACACFKGASFHAMRDSANESRGFFIHERFGVKCEFRWCSRGTWCWKFYGDVTDIGDTSDWNLLSFIILQRSIDFILI